ncbi:hypothetical protein V5O48_014458 [Marasmius crinis-equi]|uniref:MFS general substrate transporter n=1 Tax=Marasmius crinis-equi TaxID=585013 RepID=A0ABR3EXA7_9AGAR
MNQPRRLSVVLEEIDLPCCSSQPSPSKPKERQEDDIDEESYLEVVRVVVANEVEDEAASGPTTRLYQSLLLISGFMMTFFVIGISSTYGIYQEFYTSFRSNISDALGQEAAVSLVGAMGIGFTWVGGVFVNVFLPRGFGNVKVVALMGAFAMTVGLVLASIATKLWHLFLTQGLLYGLGASMYYFSILSVTPLYFKRYRAFAVAVVLAGGSIGGLALAPVQQYLIDRYGVQWSLRILGMWNLAVGISVSMVMRQPPSFGGGQRSFRIGTSFTDKATFWYQALGAFLQAAGNIVPAYYIVAYSVSVLSLSPMIGSVLLGVNSGVDCISRAVVGVTAGLVGRQNTMIGGVIFSTISVFCLWYGAAEARFIAFVVTYGVVSGGYDALLSMTVVELYGVENYVGVNGSFLLIRGLGSLLGPPIAGVFLGSQAAGEKAGLEERYNRVVIYNGSLLAVSALCAVYVRYLDTLEKQRWKWRA